MKRITLTIAALLWLTSCNNAENEKKNAATMAGITAKSTATAKSAATVLQDEVSMLMYSFEANRLKNEPERAKPVYERAMKIKKHCNDLADYLAGLKSTVSAQGPADFEKTKTDLFKHIDETVDKVGGLLDRSEKAGSRNYLFIDDRASVNQGNIAAIIDLLLVDNRLTELAAIKAVVGTPGTNP